MSTENEKIWTAALRSGDYAQVTGSLGKDEDGHIGYCCLGVCEVLAGVEGFVEDTGYIRFERDTNVLGEVGQTWLGVDHETPHVDFPEHMQSPDGVWLRDDHHLASLNDSGLTFSQLADLIDFFGLVR